MSAAASRLQLIRTLLAAPDLGWLSDEAVRILHGAFNARTTTLFLYSKRGLLVPKASAGIVPSGADAEAYVPGEDLVGYCAIGSDEERFGVLIVTRDAYTETSEQFHRIFGSILHRDTEIVYAPLNGPNRTYGVLRFIGGYSATGEESRFSQEELKEIDDYAYQVGISISSLRRKIEIDVLSHASKLLAAEPTNVHGVYELVTSSLVAEATEYAACSIRIRDRRGGDLVLESLIGATGMNMVEKDRAARRLDAGFVGEVFQTHEPRFINDVQQHTDEFHDPRWLRENNIATAAIFPIYLDDDNIGVLALYLWYPYTFYDSKIDFLKNLCHRVATATRVVELLTARQQLIERMSGIVSHAGTASELLQTILDAACDLTRAWQGYISLISRRDGKLHPEVTSRHLSRDDIPPIDVNGLGLTALAVREKRPVRRDDVTDDSDYVDFIGDARGKTRSELVVPLLHEHVLGVIALQSDRPRYFSESDELLLETLAQYATLIFQRDRLYEGTKKLARIDFSRANREHVMTVIPKSAVELVDADAAILRTYNSATRELLLEAYYPEMMNAEHVSAALQHDDGACWQALTERDVLKFDNLVANPLFQNRELVMANGYTDMVSVPLLLPSGNSDSPTELGVVNIFFRTPSPFFDVERELLRALGISASYAIHDLSIIEKASRAHSMAAITAQTTAALDLSSKLAHQALKPLREARSAYEAIGRAVRRQDPVGIPGPLRKLQTHLASLESLIAQLAPEERVLTHRGQDHIEVLSEAFRLMHTNLFASSRPHLNINETELWDNIKSALRRVIKLVRLPLAAAFISSHRDYAGFRRVVSTRGGKHPPGVEIITLPSFDEFAWLVQQTHVILPRRDGHFAWLDPQTVIGTPEAVLYGHEVTGGRLMIIVLGVEKNHTLGFEDLATLYESVAVQIFTYIDNAMFGIELDFLTSETGHLMGRAIGKIESGIRVFKQYFESPGTVDPTLPGLAESAVDNGLVRLKLIHSNFYRFGAQRRFLEATSADEHADTDQFDVGWMISDMLPMFRREAVGRGLKSTRFENRERFSSAVRGPEDLLRLTFLNLYDNALKFAYANTFIDIRLYREAGFCIVEFENLGIGVAPDEQMAVFERLRRSRFQDPAKRIEGLGLGLAYCRRVVEDVFRGRIELTSRSVGSPRGPRFEGDNWLTTVRVTLPLLGPEFGERQRA